MKKILVTGASGFVGKQLLCDLHGKYKVYALSRKVRKSTDDNLVWITWEQLKDLPKDLYGVVNLMGENIAGGLWTKTRKEKILSSRVKTGLKLLDYLQDSNIKPKNWIQASAIGYYGEKENVKDEFEPRGEGFLADVCSSWEQLLNHEHLNNVDKHILRISLVLGDHGGLVKKISPIFKMALGGKLGSGKQKMSWIAVEDLSGLIVYLLENPKSGIYNAVADEIVVNEEFTKVLADHYNRPAVFPVPAFVLKSLLGELSQLMLGSQFVKSSNLKDVDYKFKYNKLIERFPKKD